MKLSLRNRVAWSFIVANFVILVLGLSVFYYLDNLNKDIIEITKESNRITWLTDEIRISAVSIFKYQRRILNRSTSKDSVERLINLTESFSSTLVSLDSLYTSVEVKKAIAKVSGYLDSLQLILKRSQKSSNTDSKALYESITELADKILGAFGEFHEIQYEQNQERDKKFEAIISENKRHMMYTLIIIFVGTMLLGLVIPGKMALPFKKINDAIRELQDCNFDVSIDYDQDDEIGEMSVEMNKMIHSFKTFEELRADRISLEKRKFDALANNIHKLILLSNADSQLIYMNNRMYSLLQVQSDDIIYKNFSDSKVPKGIIKIYEMAIKRRSKIENEAVTIYSREPASTDVIKKDQIATNTLDESEEKKELTKENDGEKSEEKNIIFEGYATVIPVRAKESSLDYYLMIVSEQVIS